MMEYREFNPKQILEMNTGAVSITMNMIFQCSYFSQSLLNEQYCNVYNGVLGGALGALDAIPLDKNDRLRDVHLLIDDDYYYNFPVELDDEKYPFGFLGGTYYRVILLLTKEEREVLRGERMDPQKVRIIIFRSTGRKQKSFAEKGKGIQTIYSIIL